jgi:hypothetical protein
MRKCSKHGYGAELWINRMAFVNVAFCSEYGIISKVALGYYDQI